MSAKKVVNPFYPVLVVVGVAFAITACAYGMMTVKMLQPEGVAEVRGTEVGLLPFLDHHGLKVLLTELGLLAVLTFTAIGSDDYWIARAEARQLREPTEPTE